MGRTMPDVAKLNIPGIQSVQYCIRTNDTRASQARLESVNMCLGEKVQSVLQTIWRVPMLMRGGQICIPGTIGARSSSRAAAGVAKMAIWKGVDPVYEDCMRAMSTSQGQAMYATSPFTGRNVFPLP